MPGEVRRSGTAAQVVAMQPHVLRAVPDSDLQPRPAPEPAKPAVGRRVAGRAPEVPDVSRGDLRQQEQDQRPPHRPQGRADD